jgi:hypothetical protein
MVVDADPMTLLSIREQKMGGFEPMCLLSVVALFGPLFERYAKQKLRRARVVPQSSVMASLPNVNLWTLQLLVVGHYYRQGDYWVVNNLWCCLALFPPKRNPERQCLSRLTMLREATSCSWLSASWWLSAESVCACVSEPVRVKVGSQQGSHLGKRRCL